MIAHLLALSSLLRPPATATCSGLVAQLTEEVIAASHRAEGGASEEQEWQDRRLRWQAAAIPIRLIRALTQRPMDRAHRELLVEMQRETALRILRDDPQGVRLLTPALDRLRRFLQEGRELEHLEFAAWDVQRVYRQGYSAFRLADRRAQMRRDFEAGRPWSHR